MDTPARTPTKLHGNLQTHGKRYSKFDVKIIKKTKISHDVYKYVCELPDPNLPLGLPITQHIYICATVPTPKNPKGESIMRMYTPTSPPDQLGTFDLTFKVYRKDVHPQYKDGGPMSQYLETLQVGDKFKVFGPVGLFGYGAPGTLQLLNMVQIPVKKIGLICGGTGINVFYPVIRAILNNPEDKTQVTLLFANNTLEDILFKEELDEAGKDPRIKVYYTLAKPPAKWDGYEGFVNKKMIQETMPQAGKDTFMWVCGPEVMDNALAGQLEELKYPKERTVIASWYRCYMRIAFRSVFFCTYRAKNN